MAKRSKAVQYPWVLPVAACLVGLFWAFHPIILSGFGRIIGDHGDARLVNYFLEHSYLWAIRRPDHQSFWNLPNYFPALNVTAYSETLVGVAPFYAIWRVLGFLPDSAFQLWLFTVSILNFIVMLFFLQKGLKFRQLPAVAGAFLFAFGSPRLAQLNHAQLLPQFYTVGVFYALVRLFSSKGDPRRWILLFSGCMVLQLYAGFYLGWFLFFGLLVFGLCALSFKQTRRQILGLVRMNGWALLLAFVASMLALAPMMIHYSRAASESGWRSFAEISAMIPTLQSWWYLGKGSWLYSWLNRLKIFRVISMAHEHAMGVGLVTAILCGMGIYENRKSKWGRVLLISLLVTWICVTKFPHNWTLWEFLYLHIPGAQAIRSLSRIGIFLLIPASIGLAGWLERRKITPAILALCLLAALEQGFTQESYDKQEVRAQVAQIVAKIDHRCSSFYYYVVPVGPTRSMPFKYQQDALFAEMATGVPTLNGNSGNTPPGYGPLNNNIIMPAHTEGVLFSEVAIWEREQGLNPASTCLVKGTVSY